MNTKPCQWPGCEAKVKQDLWGCRVHWLLLPREIRQDINHAADIQRRHGTVGRYYAEAPLRAQAWIASRTTAGAA